MKKKLIWISIILIVIGFVMYKFKSDKPIEVIKIFPVKKDIQNKLFVSGMLYPLKEVNVKPTLSGIIKKLYVQVGQNVSLGQPIAEIQIVASPLNIENAERNLKSTEVNFNTVQQKYLRNKKLFEQENNLITAQEFEQIEREYHLAENDLASAKKQLSIAKQGYLDNGNAINIIRATISGMILEIPIKEGSSVIERNNFNEGTTIATIGDMSTIMFKGKVPEQNLYYLNVGMPLEVKIASLNDKVFKARLNRIYPKSIVESGITKFEIEGHLIAKNDSIKNIRSGMTGVATIILQEAKQVVSIDEKYIAFSNDTSFVWVFKNNQKIKTPVKTGVSDGIYVEVKEGLQLTDEIKEN